MHGQTLETIWSTRRFQLIDSNHHFDLFYWIFTRRSFGSLLDCWHARHLQKPLCMMQAWEKKHRASQPKSSLGAPKNGAFAALERQKCLRCDAEKNMRCRGGSEHLRFPPPKSQFLSVRQSIARCHVEAKHEVVVVSLACFAAFPDCQFCTVQEHVKGAPNLQIYNCCLPVVVFMEAIILCNQNGNLKPLSTSTTMT